MSSVWSVGVVEIPCSISVSLGCSLVCSGSDTGGGGTLGSGTNRMTRSRSRRSRAESNSFGNRTCKVSSTDRSAGDACLRGLLLDSVVVVVVDDEFRDLIRDVMKARDFGRVMMFLVTLITIVKCFDDIAAVGLLFRRRVTLSSVELWLIKSDSLEIGHSMSIYHLLIIICYIEYGYTFNDQKTSIAMHIRDVVVYDWVIQFQSRVVLSAQFTWSKSSVYSIALLHAMTKLVKTGRCQQIMLSQLPEEARRRLQSQKIHTAKNIDDNSRHILQDGCSVAQLPSS